MINEEQKNERRTGLGGSDMAIIMHLNRWGSEVSLQREKLGLETAERMIETEAMWWGTQMEDLVAKRYEEVTGRTAHRYNATLRDGILIGHLDRLVVKEGEKIAAYKGEIRTDRILECKTSLDYPWDEVPLYYEIQCQHYMGLTGCQFCDVACFFKSTNTFKVYEIKRDDEVIAHMKKTAEEWWQKHVVDGIECQPRTDEDFKILYPRNRIGASVNGSDEAEAALGYIAELNETIEGLEKKRDEQILKIKDEMKDAEQMICHGKVAVTWKNNKDSEVIDWKAVASELDAPADLIASHTKTRAGARVFKIKK